MVPTSRSKRCLDLLVARQVRVQRLDGHLALRRPQRLLALVDGAHPALAEEADDLVLAAHAPDRASGRAPGRSSPGRPSRSWGRSACLPRSPSGTWDIAWLGRPIVAQFGALRHSSGLDGRRPGKDSVGGRRPGERRRPRPGPGGATGGTSDGPWRGPTARARVPRFVAGKTTPMRVLSLLENEGDASGSGAPRSGKSKRTRSTRVGPSKSSSANRPIARGVAWGGAAPAGCSPSSQISPRSQRRSKTHCERSTSGGGSGGVLVMAMSGAAPRGAPASSARDTSMIRRGSSASADSAAATQTSEAVRIRRARMRWQPPTRRGLRQERTRGTRARPGRATRRGPATPSSPGTTTRAAWSATRPGSRTRPVGSVTRDGPAVRPVADERRAGVGRVDADLVRPPRHRGDGEHHLPPRGRRNDRVPRPGLDRILASDRCAAAGPARDRWARPTCRAPARAPLPPARRSGARRRPGARA